MSTRTVYELEPEGDRQRALDNVIADITAAHRLKQPFQVKTVKYQEFRRGGNVTKAKILSYEVIVGQADVRGRLDD